MSLLKAKKIQIGTHATASNNFVIEQPTTPDGTLRIGNGNEGSSTTLLTLESAGLSLLGNSSVKNAAISGSYIYHNSRYIGRSADNSTATLFYLTLIRRVTTRNATIGTFTGARESSSNAASGMYQVNATQGTVLGTHGVHAIFSDIHNNPSRLVTLTHDAQNYVAIEITPSSTFRAFDAVFFTGLTFGEQQHSLKYLEASQVSGVTAYTTGIASNITMDSLNVRSTLIIPVV